MFIEERLEKILKIVNEKGKITVDDVLDVLKVSQDTIRRDFIRLYNKGLVHKTHGGILAKNSLIFDPGLNEKVVQFQKEKELIGEKAASLVNDSDVIIIDAGTTTEKIIKNLVNKKNLTILTNALNIANEAVKLRDITTMIIGGTIRNSTLGIIGPDSIEMIRNYHANKLFLAASGISLGNGLMTPNRLEAEIKKELIKVSREIILVADSSKINKPSLFTFATIKEISIFITDNNADPAFIEELKDSDIEVIIANSQ